jgi:hypothetical protein
MRENLSRQSPAEIIAAAFIPIIFMTPVLAAPG